MSEKVVVVIPNWSGQQYLEACLSSILQQTCSSLKVILVDNGSTDGSVEFVSQRFPRVEIIRNEENLGFAHANNMAIRASDSEYVATVNNDVQLDPCWLEEMLRVADSNPDAGMFACKMLYYHCPELIDSAGIWVDKSGTAWNRLCGERDEEQDLQPIEVFGSCAGAALYRRETLESVSLFDEDFFAYYEDVDLAWRTRLLAWRCLYIPAARAYHIHSATGEEVKRYLIGRNKIFTIIKDYPMPQLLLFSPLILFYEMAAVTLSLLSRRDANPLKGRLASLRYLPGMLEKRRNIQKQKAVGFSQIVRHMAPLENPLQLLTRQRKLQRAHQLSIRTGRSLESHLE